MSTSSEDESFELSPTDKAKPDEEEAFLQQHKQVEQDEDIVVIRRRTKTLTPRLVIMVIANTLATIGIVFTNKRLFDKPDFKWEQVTFAAFHFAFTGSTLYLISRPFIGIFDAKKAPFFNILPLAMAMCLNVIVPNLSLQYSSITFYQIARILLTPTVAFLNWIVSEKTIPLAAGLALIPASLGVGTVTYFDRLPAPGTETKTTSLLGVIFAFVGVFCSSVYTVLIAKYHRKLEMSSMQLLLNQAPISVLMLLYIIPFSDDVTIWTAIEMPIWGLIFLSAIFACIINLTQFFIVNEAGPVSSTVVGHLKTCCIVALGWIVSGRTMKDWSFIGIILALGGIIWYSVVMQRKPPA